MEPTTRQRIADLLRDRAATASELAESLSLPTHVVYEHLEHVSQSVGDDETFLVSPPVCHECGFDGFDQPMNHPSRCPDCRSERIEEPAFRID